ncbi:MerR family transcriptional regulator [Kribbella jejuensis]|uniref:DNA-binding transcriptional MerR regulator n=1 Tax=Kribbella jejuensis TaxID=236068 RepID=A0A542ETK3_9ACTN|nr:MerR family transcriptional regulator [Kribbella jejuensis]TQJ18697.1 DNA-binding transcriptional MerR regulator [Kribbella jejuensis]
MTISEFARLVGLAPSALRFYDDCGLLPPADVDTTNGYRYYDPSQADRARLLRDLRELDLPLPDVRRALDAPPSEVVDLIRAHLRTLEAKSTATREAATRLLTQLLSEQTTAVLGGPEFASAIRQVTPAAAPAAEVSGAPVSSATAAAGELDVVLRCVLVELSPEEVVFVATDRYRLAVRSVRPVEFGGASTRVLVPAAELAAVGRWVAAGDGVRVEVDGGLRLVRGDEAWELTAVDAEYPAYQQILDGLAPPVCRVVVDRLQLLNALEGREVVVFDIDPEVLRIGDEVTLDVIGTGSTRIGFTASLLAAALAASVGPDVLLEICEPSRPVVVRSADQGTFTTLVMPVRLDG